MESGVEGMSWYRAPAPVRGACPDPSQEGRRGAPWWVKVRLGRDSDGVGGCALVLKSLVRDTGSSITSQQRSRARQRRPDDQLEREEHRRQVPRLKSMLLPAHLYRQPIALSPYPVAPQPRRHDTARRASLKYRTCRVPTLPLRSAISPSGRSPYPACQLC